MNYPLLLLPTNEKKYLGSIDRIEKGGGYRATVRKPTYTRKSFVLYESAFAFLLRENRRRGLFIKNIIYEYEKHLEVLLTRGRRMECNKEDILLVEKYVWVYDGRYATTRIEERPVKFSSFLLPDVGKVFHLDGNKLNNRRENLVPED